MKKDIAKSVFGVTLWPMSAAAFGQQLAAARAARGLSLEDTAHATRIPVPRLNLLEAGNLAGFGSMAYARSFVRSYSDFLGVDATSILETLPGGVLGGECDYRYLTHSEGAWLRERDTHVERITAPSANRVRSIQSPLPAGIAVFVLILAGTAKWGKHVAEERRKVEPAALKAIPLTEGNDASLQQAAQAPTAKVTPLPAAARPPAPAAPPVSVRKATPVN